MSKIHPVLSTKLVAGVVFGSLAGVGAGATGCSADGADGDGAGGQTASGGATTGGSGTGVGGGGTGTGGNGTGTGGNGTGTGGSGTGTGGGVTGMGGSGPVGSCSRPVSSCSSPQVTITEIDMGVPITPYGNQSDTQPLPMAIASTPSGRSRIAARATDGTIFVAELDCDDEIVGTPFSLPAQDLQDLHADDEGGVVLLTRDAVGSGEHNCGPGPLCGGSSSPCYNSFLVRFDSAGNEAWATMVTNADENQDPYSVGARFIWWYQNHGRIAFDGENYASYFCVGITTPPGGGGSQCVDIHQGDRMQVVSSNGTLVSNHPDAFSVGCSHSWMTRIVWDPRESRFVMVCTTDNNCRIAQPSPYRTVAQGTCDGTLFGGDLVLSSTPGYWTAWSQGGQIRLEHFTEGASDTTISNAGPSSHPHLVSYGEHHMLLTWAAGDAMAAQVRDAGTGDTVGAEFTIDVPDHRYQAFKAYPDGSVAYPAQGSTNTRIRVARVMPCSD